MHSYQGSMIHELGPDNSNGKQIYQFLANAFVSGEFNAMLQAMFMVLLTSKWMGCSSGKLIF